MGEPVTIKCKDEKMQEWKKELQEISDTMRQLIEETDKNKTEFQTVYMGDAKEEIELFFESLKKHLNCLMVFYKKMSDYIDMTNTSFSESDIKMTQNMGVK